MSRYLNYLSWMNSRLLGIKMKASLEPNRKTLLGHFLGHPAEYNVILSMLQPVNSL